MIYLMSTVIIPIPKQPDKKKTNSNDNRNPVWIPGANDGTSERPIQQNRIRRV